MTKADYEQLECELIENGPEPSWKKDFHFIENQRINQNFYKSHVEKVGMTM